MHRTVVPVAASLAMVSGTTLAQPLFVEATPPTLLTYEMAMGMVGGAAAADYDADGDIDVFLANGLNRPSQLLQNQGDGTFVDVAPACGLGAVHNDRAGLWFDYDGDHDLDLVVLVDNHFQTPAPETTSLRLYKNNAGLFQDVTAQADLFAMLQDPNHPDWGLLCHASGITAADFNGDGALDLYVTFWRGENHLFMNDADGTFTNASVPAGLHAHNTYWTPAAFDFDRDGDVDIFQAVDFTENYFYLNNGDTTFTNIAAALGVDNAWNEMGVTLGDPDNDGDIDVFITNICDYFQSQGDYVGRYNVHYRNHSTPNAPGQAHTLAFTEDAQSTGFARGGWGWGCTFADIDNDRWQDVAQTNGFDVPPEKGFDKDPSHLWHNIGDGLLFEDVARNAGTDDTDIGASYIAIDVERDGDLDLLQTCKFAPARLTLNRHMDEPGGGDWITIRPRQTTPGSSGHSNFHAIGAVVRVTVETHTGKQVTMTRPIMTGTSTLGQEPAEAHFGLGDLKAHGIATIETVEIEWPGGAVTSLDELVHGRVVTVVDATRADADLTGDGRVDIEDLYRAQRDAFDLTGDLIHDEADLRAVEAAVRANEAQDMAPGGAP